MNRGHFLPIFLLLTFLFQPMTATAADITEQLHRPIRSSPKRESRNEADRLLSLGEQQYQQGSYAKAIESWLQALEVYRLLDDLKAQGLTYDFLSRGYVQLGRDKAADDALRRRLAFARDLKDFQGQIFALNNIGTFLLQKGEALAALKTFSEAVEIARSSTLR